MNEPSDVKGNELHFGVQSSYKAGGELIEGIISARCFL